MDFMVYSVKKIKSNVLTVCDVFMITTALHIGLVSSHRHKAKITCNRWSVFE